MIFSLIHHMQVHFIYMYICLWSQDSGVLNSLEKNVFQFANWVTTVDPFQRNHSYLPCIYTSNKLDIINKKTVLFQDEATTWNSYNTIVQVVPSVLSNLLLSSYCDKAGHKLPLLLPVIGTFLANCWMVPLVNPALLGWPMETTLVFAFLNSFLGYYPMVKEYKTTYTNLCWNRYYHHSLVI